MTWDVHTVSIIYITAGICIYDNDVALRNCGGPQIAQNANFYMMLLNMMFIADFLCDKFSLVVQYFLSCVDDYTHNSPTISLSYLRLASTSPFSASPHYNHLVSSPLDVIINIRRNRQIQGSVGFLYLQPISRKPPGRKSV